ncbi:MULTISPECIES: HDIG domain-containing metalloprotein [unclassified Clostridium]|uniref:HD family phosphohydrolase n=1 Tax=unclassified Clostridium TaxID=2614128 RepID=UPI0014857985|nr:MULTISPECIES: HDIG domain-containing metalloprotein [unclassified Clostridium]
MKSAEKRKKIPPKNSGRKGAQGRSVRRVRQPLMRLIIYCVLVVMVTAILSMAMTPKRYDLKQGSIARETIYATKDVEDKLGYDRAVEAARKQVNEKYTKDEAATDEALQKVDSFFTAFEAARTKAENERLAVQAAYEEEHGSKLQVPAGENFPYPDEFIAELKSDEMIRLLSTEQLYTVLSASAGELTRLQTLLEVNMRGALDSGIQEDQLAKEREELRTALEQEDNRFSEALMALGNLIINQSLRANMIYDEEGTQLAREQAAQAVEAQVWRKGDVIVSEGDVVTDVQIAALSSLGVLADQKMDLWLYAGIALLVIVMVLLMMQYLRAFETKVLTSIPKLIMTGLTLVFTLLISLLISTINPRLAPISTCALLLTLLVGPRMALVINFFASIMAAMMLSGGNGLMTITTLGILISAMLSGMAGVFILRRNIRERSGLIIAGLGAGVINALVVIALGLITTSNLKEVLIGGLWSLGSGILSAVLCLGTLPVWETVFDVVTPTKLLELANPNHPLLRRLLLEAAGTYHHSIIVGNLAERAADAVGADMMLTRTGAFFHDIGKLSAPYFFKENQVGSVNPHDGLAPEVSASILTAHTRDGLALAQQFKLPKAIGDIILQHHGTTLTGYFYATACKAAADPALVDERDFRYSGPKPQTREAGIIMLADTVEAAVRSLEKPTQGQVEEMIRRLVREKLMDGQLDECDLTLRDLDTICEVFVRALKGIYHERVAYPQVEKKGSAKPEVAAPAKAELEQPRIPPLSGQQAAPAREAAPRRAPQEKPQTETEGQKTAVEAPAQEDAGGKQDEEKKGDA